MSEKRYSADMLDRLRKGEVVDEEEENEVPVLAKGYEVNHDVVKGRYMGPLKITRGGFRSR